MIKNRIENAQIVKWNNDYILPTATNHLSMNEAVEVQTDVRSLVRWQVGHSGSAAPPPCVVRACAWCSWSQVSAFQHYHNLPLASP